jgi:hypothetical protein
VKSEYKSAEENVRKEEKKTNKTMKAITWCGKLKRKKK